MHFIHLVKKYKFPILLTALTRVGYSLWLAFNWMFIDQHFPITEKTIWETYHHLERSATLLGRALIDVWLRWDAVHYMNIAAFGYEGVGQADTVFFPLYPYLVGFISNITSINVTVIGILVSSICTLFALIFFYKLVIVLFEDENLAKVSTTLLAVYPTAFFLHAPYTEAMFLLFTIGCILFLETRNYLTAGIFACLAGLVRPQALLLVIPFAYAVIKEFQRNNDSLRWKPILSAGFIPLGFVSYSAWRSQYGQPGLINSFNGYSNLSFQNPVSTLIEVISTIIKAPSVIRIAELVGVFLILGVLVWMFFQREFRQHPGILVYSAVTWLLIVSKTSVDGVVPQLTGRYILYIFFAFVGLAAILRKFPSRVQKYAIFASFVLSLISATLYALWIYVG